MKNTPTTEPIKNNPTIQNPGDTMQFNRSVSVKSGVPVKNFTDAKTALQFGRFLQAVAGNPGAIQYCQQHGLLNAYQAEGTNSLCGYLVPQVFEKTLIDLRLEYGVFARNAKIIDMMSDVVLIPRRASGLTAYFVGEGAAITQSTKTFNQVTLTAKKLAALCVITGELSEDAIISIADDIIGEMSYQFANKEDLCGFIGDGSNTYGKITGVIPALQAAAGTPTTTSAGGVVVGAGNTFSELTLANHTSVIGKCPGYALRNAKWYFSPTYWGEVAMRLMYSAGGISAQDISATSPLRSFLGYPAELVEVMTSTDSNSQIVALFGDLSLAAKMGRRGNVRVDYSNDAYVDSVSLFETDKTAIRSIERFDIVVHDVGSTTASGPIVGLQTLNA